AVRREDPARLVEERLEVGDPFAAFEKKRRLRTAEKTPDRLGGAGGGEKRTEVLRAAAASGAGERVEARTARVRVAGGRAAVTRQKGPHPGGLGERSPRGGLVVRRGSSPHRGAAGRRPSEGRGEPKDDLELERVDPGIVLRKGD